MKEIDEEKKTKRKRVNSSNQEKQEEKKQDEETIREVIVEKRAGFNVLEVIIIMVIAILFGALIGSAVTYTKEARNDDSISDAVPEDLQEFVQTYYDISENYYQDLDKEELLDAGIKGMIEYLNDSHSVYMDEVESEAFNEKVEGSYVGIGAEITLKDNQASVSYLFEDSPAMKAGLVVGDVIQQVDGKSVSGLSLSDISGLIKGKANTNVTIQVKRNEEIKDVVVVREKVELTSVNSHVYERNNKKIGYLDIDIFAANTSKQFKTALENLEKEKIDSLIIDVRDNPGGHLTQVSEMLSLMIEKGKVLYQIETKGIKEPTYDWTKEKRTYPVVVLMNHTSASASEILAAAMKEVYGATLVGETTYGKGTVQQAFELKSGATIKYTTQRWLTPNGTCIDEVGVEPDAEVEMADAYYDNPMDDTDNQLQQALELLQEK